MHLAQVLVCWGMGVEPGAEDYPRTQLEFEDRFRTEADCRAYLVALRWPKGFVCPDCRGNTAWRTTRDRVECAACHAQSSLTAGTIFHKTHEPLRLWFRAMWWLTSQKYGANALGLQRVLGLGSYRTAWTWLHKLRRAMVRPDRDRLSGKVEVDETFVGGVEAGGRRCHVGKKALVAIAAEIRGRAIGRIRMRRIRDSSADSLRPFIQEAIMPSGVVVTDGLPTYLGLPEWGYHHERKVLLGSGDPAHVAMQRVHRVASLLDRWWLGTYQGTIRPQHLDYSLDECTFRFNRRASRSRGKLFYRLVHQAAVITPASYQALVGGRPQQNRS